MLHDLSTHEGRNVALFLLANYFRLANRPPSTTTWASGRPYLFKIQPQLYSRHKRRNKMSNSTNPTRLKTGKQKSPLTDTHFVPMNTREKPHNQKIQSQPHTRKDCPYTSDSKKSLHPPGRPHGLVHRPREGLRGGIGEGPAVVKKTFD